MDSKSATKLKIGNKSDIPKGKGIVVSLPDGREAALFNVDGEIFALENSCPHMGGPLGEGELDEGCVTCPWHGWQFDVKTGGCLNMPGDDATSLPIQLVEDEIFLYTNNFKNWEFSKK